LHLKNILHVPKAKKNLVYVHRLAADNNAYFEFHPNFFLVKDQETKKTLLEGRCKGGLYLLFLSHARKLLVLPVRQLLGGTVDWVTHLFPLLTELLVIIICLALGKYCCISM
jgi:histone deacetylase 1/2